MVTPTGRAGVRFHSREPGRVGRRWDATSDYGGGAALRVVQGNARDTLLRANPARNTAGGSSFAGLIAGAPSAAAFISYYFHTSNTSPVEADLPGAAHPRDRDLGRGRHTGPATPERTLADDDGGPRWSRRRACSLTGSASTAATKLTTAGSDHMGSGWVAISAAVEQGAASSGLPTMNGGSASELVNETQQVRTAAVRRTALFSRFYARLVSAYLSHGWRRGDTGHAALVQWLHDACISPALLFRLAGVIAFAINPRARPAGGDVRVE